MSTTLIAGELDDEIYRVPPILPYELINVSRKPLARAIREHKSYLSQKAGVDVGWLFAKKDFFENGYSDYWAYGFKYGYRAKPSLNVDPAINSKRCQDFSHFVNAQIEAAKLTMEEICRRSYGLDYDVESQLFNEYQATYFRGGFREGFCEFACLCHACKNALREILVSDPKIARKKIFGERDSFFENQWMEIVHGNVFCTD